MEAFVTKLTLESGKSVSLETWVSAGLGSDALLTVLSANSNKQIRTFTKSYYVPTADHFVRMTRLGEGEIGGEGISGVVVLVEQGPRRKVAFF